MARSLRGRFDGREYNLCRGAFPRRGLMLSSTNYWMCLAGIIYLVAGIFVLKKEIRAACGWDKLITLGTVFIAVALAVFAPEHFHGGPEYIQSMAPAYMPVRWLWPYVIG